MGFYLECRYRLTNVIAYRGIFFYISRPDNETKPCMKSHYHHLSYLLSKKSQTYEEGMDVVQARKWPKNYSYLGIPCQILLVKMTLTKSFVRKS